jgi:hypothetical protein
MNKCGGEAANVGVVSDLIHYVLFPGRAIYFWQFDHLGRSHSVICSNCPPSLSLDTASELSASAHTLVLLLREPVHRPSAASPNCPRNSSSLPAQSITTTMALKGSDIAQHNDAKSCWVIVHARIHVAIVPKSNQLTVLCRAKRTT